MFEVRFRAVTTDGDFPLRSLSSRLAAIVGLAIPIAWLAASGDQPRAAPQNNDVAQLVQRADDANQAFMRGDMRRWMELIGPIPEDFTLMQPFGGAPSRGFDSNDAHLDQLARYFRNGAGAIEVTAAYASADLIVLVVIERQRGEVGGLPDQDWSLRVTQVYRRHGRGWELVHRHADPLVRNMGLARTAALARGD